MSKRLITEDRLTEILKCKPSSAPNGVYIYAADGYLYHPEIWDYYVANDITRVGIKGVH